MEWLRRIIRQWVLQGLDISVDINVRKLAQLEALYADLVSIGIDVHFKEPHMILIYSKINGGQLRHVEADFQDLRELDAFVEELKEKYQTKATTWDMPSYMRKGMY